MKSSCCQYKYLPPDLSSAHSVNSANCFPVLYTVYKPWLAWKELIIQLTELMTFIGVPLFAEQESEQKTPSKPQGFFKSFSLYSLTGHHNINQLFLLF